MTNTETRFEPLAAQDQLAAQTDDISTAPLRGRRWSRALSSSATALMAAMAVLGFAVFSLAVLFALSLKVTFGLMVGGSVLVGLAAAASGE